MFIMKEGDTSSEVQPVSGISALKSALVDAVRIGLPTLSGAGIGVAVSEVCGTPEIPTIAAGVVLMLAFVTLASDYVKNRNLNQL